MIEHPAITKLKLDLAWTGPNGGKQGRLVLPRELAQSLVEEHERLVHLQGLLDHIDAIAKQFKSVVEEQYDLPIGPPSDASGSREQAAALVEGDGVDQEPEQISERP